MNISLSEAIAKKQKDKDVFQSLEGHTVDSLLVFKDYLSKNITAVVRFSKEFALDYELLSTIIYLSVYLHDIGKLTVEFQENIRKGKPCGAISHPFFGFPFVHTSLNNEHKELEIILRLCILAHHSQLYNRIYEDATLNNRVIYLWELMKVFIDKTKNTFDRIGLNRMFEIKVLPIFKMPDDYNLDSFQLCADIKDELSLLKHYNKEIVKNNEPQIKAMYCLILSILKFCDAKASEHFGNSDLKTGTVYQSLFVDSDVNIVFATDVFKPAKQRVFKNSPFKYQSVIQDNLDNLYLLISAPCGRGKTEAALAKAINIIEKEGRNKIIFALPTQITSNAMYSRLKKIFGDENVGIYHSLSRFVHYLEGNKITEDDENVIQDDDISTVVREEKVFLKPVIVTTVDHLVYSLVHGYKQSDYALGSILNSVIIFDEVHYYENHTLRYVIEAMELLKRLKIPHIAMSGTLPDCIINRLGNEYVIIEDRDGFEFKPFLIEKRDSYITKAIDEIIELYHKGEKQIIIVNTVEKAHNIYKLLRRKIDNSDDIILYHAMFTHYDRAYSKDSKEAKILAWKNNNAESDHWIIVSTQAIEISIDISCTIMHTEIAPIDAIGQRGGRLNRGGSYHNNKAKMIIYKTENYKPYFFGKNGETNSVKQTENILIDGEVTYKIIKDWCSQIYKNVDLSRQNLIAIFKQCTLFGLSPKEIRYSEEKGNLVNFREIHYVKQDVIPEAYWKSELNKNPELIMVKIPFWWLRKYPDFFYVEKEKYTICTLPYSPETGFSLEKISAEDRECLIF